MLRQIVQKETQYPSVIFIVGFGLDLLGKIVTELLK